MIDRVERSPSLNREILRLAVPALGALIAEPLYVLTDTAVVGHLGRDELAGLALASAVLLTVNALLTFLAYGTTSSVARLLGAGRTRDAADQSVQAVWLALASGVVLAAVLWPLAPTIIEALGGRGNVARQGEIYLRVSLPGLPALLVMMAGVGYLRGRREAARPLLVAVGTAMVNLVIELVLIYGFDQGIGASALATVIAQWTGAAIYLAWIIAGVRHHDVALTPDLRAMLRLLHVGGHLVVRTLSLRGALVVATAVAAGIGDVDLAAHQIGYEVWSFLAFAHDAVAIAAQSLVGHALGAGDVAYARAVARRTVHWGVASGVILAVPVALARHPLASAFTDDTAVVDLAAFVLLWVAIVQPVGAAVFALDGVLIGAGDARYLAFAMVAAALCFGLAATIVVLADLGIGWLWAAVGVFLTARLVGLTARYRSTAWLVTGAG